MPYKYFYETTSEDMHEDDWSVCTVKAIIVREGFYRLYRCNPFDGDELDAPQGIRIEPQKVEKAVAEALFPSTLYGMEPDSL